MRSVTERFCQATEYIKLHTFSFSDNGFSALLRCPASASALGRASHPADRGA